MNILEFNFKSNNVRTMLIDGEPHFVAVDVARALGYKKLENAIARHCKNQTTTPKQGGGFYTIIKEPDLYRLIFGSNLESAEKFQDWVFEDVLPTLRKEGSYSLNNDSQAVTDYLPFYHDLHDQVKALADKAAESGSKTPESIFHINFNKMINKAFGFEANKRKELKPEQRVLVTTANLIALRATETALQDGKTHKEAYQVAKSAVHLYVGTVSKTVTTPRALH